MWKIAVLLLAAAAVCAAYPAPYWGAGYPYTPYWGGYWNQWGGYPYNYWGGSYGGGQYYGGGKQVFYGEFPGSCEDKPDGLYYVDERSFAYCFSGQKSIQPCAEGSANPPVAQFHHGNHYGAGDFCSINLVARGYGHPAPAPVPHQKSAYKSEPQHGYQAYKHQESSFEKEYKQEAY